MRAMRWPRTAATVTMLVALVAGTAGCGGTGAGASDAKASGPTSSVGTPTAHGSSAVPAVPAVPAEQFVVQSRERLESWVHGVPTFPVTEAMRVRPGARPLFRFTPELSARDQTSRAAAVLGVAGRPEQFTVNGVGSWGVSTSTFRLTVGDWPAQALFYEAMTRSDDLRCKGSAAPGPDRKCPDGSQPLRYDDASATRDAAALVARLAPGQALDWRPGPSGGGTTVAEGRLEAAGPDGPVLWRVSFNRNGKVTAVLGLLAPLRSVGDYPTVSVAEAVERLDADWLPSASGVWEPPVTGCPAPEPAPGGVPDQAAPNLVTRAMRPAAMPMTTLAPGASYPLPVSRATATYELLADARCTQFVAPVIRFTSDGGDQVPVLALTDDAIERLPMPSAGPPS